MEAGETIKIISHSQGGAHAAGVAAQLLSYKNEDGSQLYNVEIVEYITPHQPTDIYHPEGVKGIQYSHSNDAVSSEDPWWLPNGGSENGCIKNVTDCQQRQGGSEGRGNHSINTYLDYIANYFRSLGINVNVFE